MITIAAKTIQSIEAELQYRYRQMHVEAAALAGELGVTAQLVALSARYTELRAAGRMDEAAAVKAAAYAIYNAGQE